MPVYGDWSRPLTRNHGNVLSKANHGVQIRLSIRQDMLWFEWTFWTLLAFLVDLIFATSNFIFGAKKSKLNQSCWSANLWGETGFAYFHPDGCDEVWDGFFEIFPLFLWENSVPQSWAAWVDKKISSKNMKHQDVASTAELLADSMMLS